MAEEISIQEREARHAVELEAEPRLWQVPKALVAGYGAARTAIDAAGGEVVDMPFARYLEIDWASFAAKGVLGQFLEFLTGRQKMRSGLFTAAPLLVDGPAIATEIPAGRYVTTIHRGAYHQVGDTYRRVVGWAGAEGIELADHTLEHYIDDPTEKPMAEVRTRIWIACS